MVVLLVLGLSLATRTTQESFLSQQSSETTRVWNAAESGAEEALSRLSSGETVANSAISGATINNSTVNAAVTTSNTVDIALKKLTTLTVNLQAGGLQYFTMDWGTEADVCLRASLLVSLYYEEGGYTKVAHYTLGSGSGSGCTTRNDGFDNDTGTGFTLSDITTPGHTKYRKAEILLPASGTSALPVGATPLFARIKPIYYDTNIAVSGPTGFPEQSYTVTSTAENDQTNAAGREVRTVQVNRTLPQAPSILDYALYSGGAISKP